MLGMAKTYAHLATRLFGTPIAMEVGKLDVILSALAGKLGIEAPLASFDVPEEAVQRAPLSVTNTIATIPVTGSLVNRALGVDALSGLTSYEQLATDLQAAVEDPQVAGILLDIDSPGGEVSGLFDFVDRVEAASAVKPVVAAVNDSAFSAAYAIASAADAIYTTKTGGVGSVGVVAVHVDQSEANADAGLKVTHITFGNRKAEGNPHEPLSDSARATIQAEVDRIGDMFVATVARNRNLDPDRVRRTEAGVFFGEEGIAAGLADGLGGKEAAAAQLGELIAQEKHRMDLEQRISDLMADMAMKDAKIEALEALVLEARTEKVTAYVEKLRGSAEEHQVAVPEEKIQTVLKLFEQGQDELAQTVGDALLEAAVAKGQKPFTRDEDEAQPDPGPTSDQLQAERLRALGYTVVMNSDETKILKATKATTAKA